jgi:hypothetical protein
LEWTGSLSLAGAGNAGAIAAPCRRDHLYLDGSGLSTVFVNHAFGGIRCICPCPKSQTLFACLVIAAKAMTLLEPKLMGNHFDDEQLY